MPSSRPRPPRAWKVVEVGALDGGEGAQSLGRRRGVEAEGLEARLERLRDLAHALVVGGVRRLDQEVRGAGAAREVAHEGALGDQQLALEDALRQQAHQPQSQRPAALVGEHDVVTQATLEDPGRRVGVGEGRHHTLAEVFVEQPPRRWRLLRQRLEGEAAAGDHLRRRAEHPRTPRLVEVEAARVLARQQAEGNHRRAGERRLRSSGPGCAEAQVLSNVGAVEVGDDRHVALGHQREAAGAGAARERIDVGLAAIRGHHGEDEGGAGDQGGGEQAAAAVAGAVARSRGEPGRAAQREGAAAAPGPAGAPSGPPARRSRRPAPGRRRRRPMPAPRARRRAARRRSPRSPRRAPSPWSTTRASSARPPPSGRRPLRRAAAPPAFARRGRSPPPA